MNTAERPGGALALLGLWADIDDSDIDSFVADVAASRHSDRGRPVGLRA